MPPSNEKEDITMDRILVVVFRQIKLKLYERKRALVRRDPEGSISLYGYTVGTSTIQQATT